VKNKVRILKTNINQITLDSLADVLIKKNNLDVAVCNANSLVRSYKDPDLQTIINNFDIATPDGFPVAKASKVLYKNNQQRVDGYKIFNYTIKKSIEHNTSHYFYGNSEEVVKKIITKFKNEYPSINIVGYSCPPFLGIEELSSKNYMDEIIKLEPNIVWLSFGFPKQERLMHLIRSKYNLNSNLVGVGFTFDWTAETKVKAPEFIANLGLEWILRLIQEPRRLYKRYFIDNTLFIYFFIKQYIEIKFKKGKKD